MGTTHSRHVCATCVIILQILEQQLMSYASDVYSFGIIMYEVLTCNPPV